MATKASIVSATVPKKTATRVANTLQDQLSELISLTLQAKHYHWNVTGTHFRSVHLHMDEITNELRIAMDTVAERIVTLGAIANGQASDAAAAKLAPLPKTPIQDADAMAGMADRLSASGARARQRAEELADIDPVSESVLLTILEGMEKQIWMLRAGQV